MYSYPGKRRSKCHEIASSDWMALRDVGQKRPMPREFIKRLCDTMLTPFVLSSPNENICLPLAGHWRSDCSVPARKCTGSGRRRAGKRELSVLALAHVCV